MRNNLFNRKNLLILLLYIVFLFEGCSKIMHEEEISISKIASYDQLCSATGGVYANLAFLFYDGGSGICYANLKGDDLNNGQVNYNYYIHNDPKRNCYKAQEAGYSDGMWNLGYGTIIAANNIITQYKLAKITDKPTREILGELYLIRAYCYFRLTRTYGQIPIIDNIDISYSVPKSSYNNIYKFIEKDLKISMELLPKNNSSARIPFVTPHHGSAKAILAEVYLSWAGYPAKDASKYTLAAKEAGETIDSAGYFGLGLVDDFAYLWDKEHLYNSESVFALYCSNTILQYIWGTRGNYFYVGYVGGMEISITSKKRIGVSYFPVEINFYNNYPAGYRKEITFFTTVFYSWAKFDPKGNLLLDSLGNSIRDTGYIHIDSVNPCSRIAYRKFYYQPYEKIEVDNSHFNIGTPRVYLYRFTHTVLTYAEAMARSGQLNARAYECVNQIRRRAHHLNINYPSAFDLPTGLSSNVFADSVVWERAWELCGEPEGRWFDLVRLELVENLPKLRNPAEGGPPFGVYDKSIYFSPIPPGDTLLNPNLNK